jgi:hypothetical protein
MKDSVVVIQGPIRIDPKFMEKSINWDIIWSTWEGENVSTNFPVVYNKKPAIFGKQNVILQSTSTYNGVLKAKELGYKYVLKWRSDQYPTNFETFISFFNKNSTNVLFYNMSYYVGIPYYVDYFSFSSVDDTLRIWDPDLYYKDNFSFPEEKFTENILKFSKKINCVGQFLTEQNDIIWNRRGEVLKLSSYLKNSDFFVKNKEI